MILKVIFISCLSFVTANYDLLAANFGDKFIQDANETIHQRYRRAEPMNKFQFVRYTCADLTNTAQTPFVAVMVYKTAGRFLGMGSIISPKTVITCHRVVEITMKDPRDLIAVAGCLSPWWGKGSQVKEGEEIFVHEKGLALVNVKGSFVFNKNVAAIKLAQEEVKNYEEAYTIDNAIFGIFRGSWDVPGDKTAKNARYIMQIESIRDGSNDIEECKKFFPDEDFVSTYQFCTSANATFCWGCLGSPSVAINKEDEVLQIAVVTKTTYLTEKDKYHIHTKIGPFILWLKGHGHLDYPKPRKG